MAAAALYLSIILRLGVDGGRSAWREFVIAAFLYAFFVGASALAFGMNRGVWRYASLSDLIAIVKTATVAILLFIAAHFLLTRLQLIPRSTVVIAWAFTVVLLSTPRAAYRLYRNRLEVRRTSRPRLALKRVFLVGANDNADVFLKVIHERSGVPYEVVAILDERGRRTGRVIRGIPVLGGPEDIPKLVRDFERRGQPPAAIILARSRDEYQLHASLERLIAIAAEQHLELLRLPNLLEMASIDADLEITPFKLEDLLQRPPIQHDTTDLAKLIAGHKVLITGAGGSIGSELARQVIGFQPKSLVLVDSSEFLLYSIEKELNNNQPQAPVTALLCNVREKRAVHRLIAAERPDIVFHAAALKHVPIVEMQPLEGIWTNALGTRNVAEACRIAKVKAMIMISTDKAVNPANVMGGTKRLAEMFCQANDVQAEVQGTRFVTVRFGNVLGSAGSVVPLFERQIKAGGPVTVTHPEIERYFMTIPEACLLVMQAAAHALGHDDERGKIFVLDMGTPVKIVDLARNLIRLSGMRPDVDIRIVYTGLRPGEKLYEELFAAREKLVGTGMPAVLAAFPHPVDASMIVRIFDEMERLVEAGDLQGALRLLRSTVPEFSPGPSIQTIIENQNPHLHLDAGAGGGILGSAER
jgi:O-antigen biosynthesis protein WbqV